jgi:hypothetical protein
MRAIMIAMLAGAGIGFFGVSDIAAAPAGGAVIGAAAAGGQAIEKARYYRRHYRRRAPYTTDAPYERVGPYGGTTAHQQSQENERRALQNWNGGIK